MHAYADPKRGADGALLSEWTEEVEGFVVLLTADGMYRTTLQRDGRWAAMAPLRA